MRFEPEFEKQEQQENNVDKAKEVLENRSWHRIKKLIKAWMAAGIIAVGAGSLERTAEEVEETSEKIENVIESTKNSQENKPTPKEVAETFIERNVPDSLSPKEQQSLTERVESILQNYGVNEMAYVYTAHEEHNTPEEEQVEQPDTVAISNFEAAGLSSDSLRKIWSEEYYPKGSIKDQIQSVEYVDSTYSESDTSDIYRAGHIKGGEKITFFRPEDFHEFTPMDLVFAFDDTFGHELTHANDWVSDKELDLIERVNFMYDAHTTFKQSTFRDSIDVNSLKDLEGLSGKEQHQVLREWFADIGELYFSTPEEFKTRHPDEYSLADKWLTKNDPDFDPAEAVMNRSILYDDIPKTTQPNHLEFLQNGNLEDINFLQVKQ